MEVIKWDLRELQLGASRVSEIFWRAADPDGAEKVIRRIKEQYIQILSALHEGVTAEYNQREALYEARQRERGREVTERHPMVLERLKEEETRKLGALVELVVVLGAVRGLGWGQVLKERDSRRKRPDKCTSVIIRCRMAKNLLSRENQVSVREVCKALDKKRVEFPWRMKRDELPPFAFEHPWEHHSGEKKVMNAIRHARERVQEEAEDIRYLKAAVIAAKEAAKQKVDAIAARKKPRVRNRVLADNTA